ncbi:hypothetical protein H0H92_011307 [Tricholoma furcatifolium]|nr:hypothetical protein H0H92_011307 [Tricholoma furcatifolium]
MVYSIQRRWIVILAFRIALALQLDAPSTAIAGATMQFSWTSAESDPSTKRTPAISPSISDPTAAQPSSSSTQQSDKVKNTKIGAIVGGIIGGLSLFSFILMLWVCVRRRQRTNKITSTVYPLRVDPSYVPPPSPAFRKSQFILAASGSGSASASEQHRTEEIQRAREFSELRERVSELEAQLYSPLTPLSPPDYVSGFEEREQ